MTAAHDTAIINMLRMREFNHNPTWTEAKPPHDTKRIVGHVRNLGNNDTELINTYGNDALEATCLAADFPKAPIKFDKLTLADGRILIVQDVRTQIGFNGAVLIYKLYLKGR